MLQLLQCYNSIIVYQRVIGWKVTVTTALYHEMDNCFFKSYYILHCHICFIYAYVSPRSNVPNGALMLRLRKRSMNEALAKQERRKSEGTANLQLSSSGLDVWSSVGVFVAVFCEDVVVVNLGGDGHQASAVRRLSNRKKSLWFVIPQGFLYCLCYADCL